MIEDRPHQHHWKYIRDWSETICSSCISNSRDGIVMASHPDLVERLTEKGVDLKVNSKGHLIIPQ
jgi:hypothetical protein